MSGPPLLFVGVGDVGRRAAEWAHGFVSDSVLWDAWDVGGAREAAPFPLPSEEAGGHAFVIGRLDGPEAAELVPSALHLREAGVPTVAVVTVSGWDEEVEGRRRRLEDAGVYVVAVPAGPAERAALSSLIDTLRGMLEDKGGAPSEPPVFGIPEEDEAVWARRSRGGRVAANGGGAPSATDLVSFTVTHPALVEPGATILVDLWAHTDEERDEVLRRARDQALEELRHRSQGPSPLARGTELEVELAVDGIVVADARQPLGWHGAIANAAWFVDVPADESRPRIAGTVTVRAGPLRVAAARFLLQVGRDRDRATETSEVRRIRRAFASYSSEDRSHVLARVQGMRKARPDLDVFVDVIDLRSGQDWARELERHIGAADVLFLFWSDHARRSEWVEKEWRMGLTRRGLDFIDPVPLVPPDVAPPPEELASKHFNDLYLAFMQLGGGEDRP